MKYMYDPEGITDRFEKLFDESKLTVDETAYKINRSIGTIRHWLKGDFRITRIEDLLRICNEYGCTLEWLVFGKKTNMEKELTLAIKQKAIDGMQKLIDEYAKFLKEMK